MTTTFAPNPALDGSAARTDAAPVTVSFRVTADGGFSAAVRVVAMLRTRGYEVRRLSVDVTADGRSARICGHLTLPAGQHRLLLARLERLPTVLEATVTAG